MSLDLNSAIIAVGSFAAALAAIGAVGKWLIGGLIREMNTKLEATLTNHSNRLDNLESDLSVLKTSVRADNDAFERRQEKFEEELRNVTQNVLKLVGDFQHAQDLSKVESKIKLDAMKRIEDGQRDIKVEFQAILAKQSEDHKQWVEQVTASLREIRDVRPRD